MPNTCAFRASFNMTAFSTKLATLNVLLLVLCVRSYALPPLGLTQVSVDSTLRPNLELIDGTAYLGVAGGVWTVDASGSLTFITLSHATLGAPNNTTRVVKAVDGELYVAANYYLSGFSAQPALYRLDEPTSPFVIWDNALARSVDSNLHVFGNTLDFAASYTGIRLLLDGTIEPLLSPGNNADVNGGTPSGYILGDANFPGTIGSEPAIWTPTGELSFLHVCCISTSIRDRADGDGVNVGWDGAGVKYGSGPAIYIEEEDGSRFEGLPVIVSHSDFSVIQGDPGLSKYAFYPGINPDFPNRAMPLLDVFPELASIDIDVISDLASVDGYLYMTLSGDDGTFLFGARDPSVIIPEPTSAVLALLTAAVFLRRVRPTIS